MLGAAWSILNDNQSSGTMIIVAGLAVVAIAMLYFTLKNGWSHDFVPSCSLVVETSLRDEKRDELPTFIQDLCDRKGSPVRITNLRRGKYTLGFLKEDDLLLIMMSLPPECDYEASMGDKR